MSDFKFCPMCGAEVKKDHEYCYKCGFYLNGKLPDDKDKTADASRKPKTSNKNYLSVLVVILIIAVVAFTGFSYYNSHGDMDAMKFSLMPHKIAINSVDLTGSEDLNSDDYKGHTKSYKITYTAKDNLKDTTVEIYPYSSDGKQLDVMANFFGLNSLNILCYDDNISSGASKTADVMFGKKNSNDFNISYLKVFVYKEKPNGDRDLIDKFTYDVNQ